MNTATIRALFRTRLLAMPQPPVMRYEGVKYERPATTTYVDDEVRAGTMTVLANGTTESRPLYLLTIHTPSARVLADMDRLVDELANAFEAGRTLTDDDRTHQLQITSVSVGALRVLDTGWGYRRITIGATAWSFRTTLLTA